MPSFPSLPTLFHPASGLLILGTDWLLFSGGVLSLGVSLPLLLLGALLSGGGVAAVQMRYGAERPGTSVLKGLAAGIVVGLPLPIAGTGVGGLVLALSGLNRLRRGSSADREDPPPPSPES